MWTGFSTKRDLKKILNLRLDHKKVGRAQRLQRNTKLRAADNVYGLCSKSLPCSLIHYSLYNGNTIVHSIVSCKLRFWTLSCHQFGSSLTAVFFTSLKCSTFHCGAVDRKLLFCSIVEFLRAVYSGYMYTLRIWTLTVNVAHYIIRWE